MSRFLSIVSVIVASSSLAGCWAQAVEQDRWGGDIVLGDKSEEARAEAEDIMEAHCGPENYQVDGWDEVVVDVRETPHGYEDVLELHMYYSCLKPTSPL